jgi:hypothetical protein
VYKTSRVRLQSDGGLCIDGPFKPDTLDLLIGHENVFAIGQGYGIIGKMIGKSPLSGTYHLKIVDAKVYGRCDFWVSQVRSVTFWPDSQVSLLLKEVNYE